MSTRQNLFSYSQLPLGKIRRFAVAVSLCGCVLIPAIAQCAPNYRDPAGRYALQIPQGWNTTQMNNDAVQFASGSAYVTMLVLPGADPVSMMNSIGTQTSTQWRNVVQVRRGNAHFGGRTGQYVIYSGTNPKGSDAYLQLLSITDGSVTYLLMMSAPQADFTRLKSDFDRIEHSFTLTVAAKPLNGPPPGPAGAIEPSKSVRSAVASTVSVNPPAAGGGNGNVYRMKLVRIVDERGFERPMTALTLLIPTDWQFQGGVQYGQAAGCHANLVRLSFRAVSPDGQLGIELFPGNTWQWADDPRTVNLMRANNQRMAKFGVHGCDIMAPLKADTFLRQFVIPGVRHGARVTGVEPMPDAARRLQEEARQLQQVAAMRGMRENVWADVSRVRVSYAVSGQPVEEWFTAMTSSTSIPGPNGRMGQTLYYTNAADHVFGMRAPQGQLDAHEKFFQLVLSTVRMDPQWEGRVRQVIANMAARDSKSAADRSRIIAKAGQDQAKIMHDTYQNATNSREHSMEGWSQYMRGVGTFRNPNTGDTVELSNQYSHVWAGPDNQYILTDSANFTPKGNYTQLEAVPR